MVRARSAITAVRPGLGVAGLGVLLLAAAVAVDAEPLYVPGLALVALFVFAVGWVTLGLLGADVTREISARRVIEGAPLGVVLTVRRRVLAAPGTRLLDPVLGGPRALASSIGEQRLRVDARFGRRGARELAAPALEVCDPVGLLRVRRTGSQSAAGPASILVLPRVEPVVAVRGDAAGDGGGRHGRRAGAGAAETEMDGLRPLRPGTPASRIHWSALARGAGLLERRMLPDADARPMVVLDPRAPASEEALDAAVRAAASLAVSLARGGGCALLLPGDRRPADLDAGLHGWAALHVRLALLQADGNGPLLVPPSRRGPLLLVLAHVPGRTPRILAGSQAVARTLVVPDDSAAISRSGRRAAFTVGGCTGYELPRTEARTPGLAGATARTPAAPGGSSVDE